MKSPAKRTAAPTARGPLASPDFLRAAFGSLQTNVFIADPKLNLIYANDRALETLRGLEGEVRKAFGIGVDEFVGGSIHRFHRDARMVERVLHNPAALPHQTVFTFGAVTLETRINGIFGPAREVLGYIVHWEDVTHRRRVQAEQTRLMSMLENAPTNVMLADLDLKIIYVNPASLNTLRKVEKHLPVKADEVRGSSVDIFHRNPAYQRNLLSDPKNLPVRANINIGPEVADLLVTAIYDGDKNYLGPMLTWELITEKLAAERKVHEAAEREREQAEGLRTKVESILEVVNAAARGDLTRDVTVAGANAIGQMGEGLGRFFGTLRKNVANIAQTAQTLAGASQELTAVS